MGLVRPNWDDFYLEIAHAASLRGDCIRRQVGAVVVKRYKWGTVTSLGYNGTDPGGPSCLAGDCPRCLDDSIPSGEQYEHCIERHAEDNALDNATFDTQDATVYVTCKPCDMCIDLLVDHEVARAVWPEGEIKF